jgi:hypothetical protein
MARRGGSVDQGSDDATVEDVVEAIDANTAVQLAALREEVKEVKFTLAAVVGLDAMSEVLENGFGTISDELRRIVPPSTAASLDKPVARRIEWLRESLSSQDLSNIGRLEVGYTSVSFVGAPIDDRDHGKGDAS